MKTQLNGSLTVRRTFCSGNRDDDKVQYASDSMNMNICKGTLLFRSKKGAAGS